MSWFLKVRVLHFILVNIFDHFVLVDTGQIKSPGLLCLYFGRYGTSSWKKNETLIINDWVAGLAKTVDLESLLKYLNLLGIQGSLFFVILGETSLEKTQFLADFIKN